MPLQPWVDAYLVILDAIQRANSADPLKIRDALAETKNFEGATGIITMDENRRQQECCNPESGERAIRIFDHRAP